MLLVAFVTSSMAATYSLDFNGNATTVTPTGSEFFTKSSTWSLNTKYTGTYNSTAYTSGLKMESATSIKFTTTGATTLTIVQSLTYGSTNYVKVTDTGSYSFVGSSSNRTDNSTNNVGVYEISLSSAGTYTIVRNNSEMGILYVSVVDQDASKVAKPTISPVWGASYGDATTVTLTCSTDGADIYYTTDGTTPSASSTKYTAAFEVTSDCTVKAIGIKDGLSNSDVAEQAVTINNLRKVNFDFSAVTLTQGSAPSSTTAADNSTYTLPNGRLYYIDGQTQTGWNDGTNDYALGGTVTMDKDYTFTPVFAANSVALGDVETTVNWTFATANGAPSGGIEGKTGYYAAQTTINGTKLDVIMTIDATTGKWNTTAADNRAQVNSGTKFTIPAIDGMKITYTATNGTITTEGATFDGNAGTVNSSTNSLEYTYSGSATTINIVDGGKNLYPSGLTVVYPSSAPKYTVTYAAGEGAGSMDEAKYEENAQFQLPASTFTAPSGKVFKNWLCSVDNNTYAAGDTYTMTAAATTFTAQYEKALGTIVDVTLNGGSNYTFNTNKIGATYDTNLSSGKYKLDKGVYVGLKGDFKAGDILTINISTKGGTNDWYIFNSNATPSDANLVYHSTTGGTETTLKYTLESDQTALYLSRSSDDSYCKWNPTLSSLVVTRHGDIASTVYNGNVKVNDADPVAKAADASNVITLDGSYSAAPTVALEKKMTYEDGESETDYADVTMALNAGETYYEGTITFGLTEYTVKAAYVAPVKYNYTYSIPAGMADDIEGGSDYNLPATLPTPQNIKTGYKFDAWYTDNAYTTKAVAGASLTEDVILYANFKINNPTITPASGTIAPGHLLVASVDGVTLTGCARLWSSSNTYTQAEIDASENKVTTCTVVDGTLSLAASATTGDTRKMSIYVTDGTYKSDAVVCSYKISSTAGDVTESITTNVAGWASYTPSMNCTLSSGAKAYVMTGLNASNKLEGTEVSVLKAGNGYFIKGTASTNYTATYSDQTPSSETGVMKGVVAPVTVSNPTGEVIYRLATDSSTGKSGLYSLADGVEHDFAKGKAYMVLTSGSAPESIDLDFDFQPTSINGVKAYEATSVKNGKYVKNGRVVIVKDGKEYNVAGQQY